MQVPQDNVWHSRNQLQWCNGIDALWQGTVNIDITNPDMSQFNLVGASRNAPRRCPMKWTPKHVKGHQDNDVDAVLDRHAEINIEMDLNAKAHWYQEVDADITQHCIFREPWSLWIAGEKVSQGIWSIGSGKPYCRPRSRATLGHERSLQRILNSRGLGCCRSSFFDTESLCS